MSDQGCMFKDCHKIQKPGSGYCPKHDLLARYEPEEIQKKMERVRKFKEYKAEQRKALKTSPLAALNPGFPE